MRIIALLTILSWISVRVAGQTKEFYPGLDGKTYTIQLEKTTGNTGGQDWKTDELIFNINKMTSKFMSEHERFPAALCTLKTDSSSSPVKILFSASMKNPGQSMIKWKGTIQNNTIHGTAIWTNLQGTRSYKFSGNMK